MEKLLELLRGSIGTPYGRRRVLMTVFGVLICGFGVSLCRMAGMGVDPFQCLCGGLYRVIPLSQGTAYIIISALMLIVGLILKPRLFGLGTFINLFLLGYVIDGGEQLLLSLFGPAASLGIRIVYLILGLAVLCFSSSLYMTANMGISAYDFYAICLSDRGVLPFRFMRIITDLICVGTGWALGYTPGVATIVCALLMGPVVSFINDHFSSPFLNRARG